MTAAWAARRRARRLRQGPPAPLTPEQEAEWFDVTPAASVDDLRRAELETLTSLRAAADAVRTHLQAPERQQDARTAQPANKAPGPVKTQPGLVRLRDTGLPRGVLYKAIRRGELTGHKLGRDYYLDRGELERWIADRRLKLEHENEIEGEDHTVEDSMETDERDPFMLALQSGRLRRIK